MFVRVVASGRLALYVHASVPLTAPAFAGTVAGRPLPAPAPLQSTVALIGPVITSATVLIVAVVDDGFVIVIGVRSPPTRYRSSAVFVTVIGQSTACVSPAS